MNRCRSSSSSLSAPALLALLCFALLMLRLGGSRAAPLTGELRCQCIQVVSKVIPFKQIANVELIPEGPYCAVSEVIATMTNGRRICLDTSARWVKPIIERILNQKSDNL